MSSVKAKAAQVASPDEIRTHFPALGRIHSAHPVAYFDGPGGTQLPRCVADAMTNYLYYHNANTHWSYPSSFETDRAIKYARATFADFLNAAPNEIAFGANMTTLTFHLARAIGRLCSPGDEIVVTELDHHANVAPWQALQHEYGLKVRMAKMNPETGTLDWGDLERLVTNQTRLLAIGAASNALGTINEVRRAVHLARSVKALVFVDAVHSAPHSPIDVRDLDCDFLSCSAYKFYGPHVGILFGKHSLLQSLDFPKLLPAPNTAPERVETGTQNHEGIVGAAAAVDFLSSLAKGATRRARLKTVFEEFHARGALLVKQLWEGLSTIKGVNLYGPSLESPRTPTVAFTIANHPSPKVARLLSSRGVFASHGDFYAATVVKRLGLSRQGLVRAGCACYTTSDEVERLIAGVRAMAQG